MRTYFVVSLVILVAMVPLAQADSHYIKHEDDKRFGEPTDDMALVYVVRPGFGHAAEKTWWFVDDQVIGVSKARGYSFALVPEGKHLFWMTIKVSSIGYPKASTASRIETGWSPGSGLANIPVLDLEVREGETYYLEIVSDPGVSGVILLDEEKGKKALEECSYSELTPKGRSRGAEIAQELIAEVRKKAAENEKRARKKAKKKAKKEAKRKAE